MFGLGICSLRPAMGGIRFLADSESKLCARPYSARRLTRALNLNFGAGRRTRAMDKDRYLIIPTKLRGN